MKEEKEDQQSRGEAGTAGRARAQGPRTLSSRGSHLRQVGPTFTVLSMATCCLLYLPISQFSKFVSWVNVLVIFFLIHVKTESWLRLTLC